MELFLNFLFHLHLSGDDPEIITGNLMGDFVKGRINNEFPLNIIAGLNLHRRIDSFAQCHPLFRQSKARLDPGFGHWRGVLVDMFYDHFLAQEWSRWSAESLEDYLQRVLKMVDANRQYLPEPLNERLDEIFGNLIPSYQSAKGVRSALERMSGRVKRSNPLAEGAGELVLHEIGLKEDFRAFLPQIKEFATDFVCKEHQKSVFFEG
jgi:acyl carrier protein phosphodiesterase